MVKKEPPNEKRVASQLKKVNKTLDDLEKIWLDGGKNKYIVGGNQISVADIQACCELEQPGLAGYVVYKRHKLFTPHAGEEMFFKILKLTITH